VGAGVNHLDPLGWHDLPAERKSLATDWFAKHDIDINDVCAIRWDDAVVMVERYTRDTAGKFFRGADGGVISFHEVFDLGEWPL
jgi:hypothetical protein